MMKHYPSDTFKVTAFQQSKVGKSCCGDSFLVKHTEEFLLCAVVDGLGSGEKAREASEKATSVIGLWSEEGPDLILSKVNSALSGYRGAVASIIKIHYHADRLLFSGIGNITVKIKSPDHDMHQPLSTQGFLSGRPLKTKVQEHSFPAQSTFLIYSDGATLSPQKTISWYRAVSSEELSDLGNNQKLEKNVLSEDQFNDDATVIIGQRL